ncbi:hypothetical protein RSOL_172920, partial [Rhizoctonia solani AG-3 Rhs1AP]
MVWSKITQVFSFGSQWGDNTVRLLEGDNALATIKRVEEILEDSMRVLESHERVMPSGEFNIFSIKHRHLVLKVVEVKQEIHQKPHQSVFSDTSEGRGPDRIARDVVRLQNHAEIFHQDLLTASRRAQLIEEERFLGSHQEGFQTPEPADPTTWYSVVSSRPSTESGSDTTTLADDQRYMAVAHVRSASPGSETPGDDDLVRQILISESKRKTVVTFGPKCPISELSNPLNESSLLEMSRRSEALLRATDPKKLEGYEVVIDPPHETSWVNSPNPQPPFHFHDIVLRPVIPPHLLPSVCDEERNCVSWAKASRSAIAHLDTQGVIDPGYVASRWSTSRVIKAACPSKSVLTAPPQRRAIGEPLNETCTCKPQSLRRQPPAVSTTQEDGSKTEWLSIVSEYASNTSETQVDLSHLSQSDPDSAQQFIATAAYIPKSALTTEEELQAQLADDDSCYRIQMCGNRRKRAPPGADTKPHLMSANYDDEDAERSQDVTSGRHVDEE